MPHESGNFHIKLTCSLQFVLTSLGHMFFATVWATALLTLSPVAIFFHAGLRKQMQTSSELVGEMRQND